MGSDSLVMLLSRVTSTKLPFPVFAIQGKSFAIERHDGDVGIAVIIQIAEVDAHAGNVDAIFAQGDVFLEADFLKLAASLAAEKGVHQLVVGNDEVHLAGEFRVSRRHSHPFTRMCAKPGLDGGITKRPIAVVDEQLVGSRLVHLGMAVLAMPVAFAQRLVIDVPLQIVDDHQIEQSIVIDVDPRPGHGPERPVLGIRLVEPSFRRDIGKGPVAIVVIERIAVDARDKNVFVAIVVVVSDGDAGVVAGSSQPSFLGDVGKVSVAVVFKEPVGIFRGSFS